MTYVMNLASSLQERGGLESKQQGRRIETGVLDPISLKADLMLIVA